MKTSISRPEGPKTVVRVTPQLNVIDINHNDRVEDFAMAKASGLLGVIHKATTGGDGADPAYAARRTAAEAAGLLWGAYHWGTAAPVDQQLAHFLKVAAPDPNTLVALDFEPTPGDQMNLDQARAFLTGVEKALGRKAVLYSGALAKTDLGVTADPFFGAHRLWLCEYQTSTPKLQASWKAWWLWQYNVEASDPHGVGPATLPGVPGDARGNLDCNYFPGDAARLKAEWAS